MRSIPNKLWRTACIGALLALVACTPPSQGTKNVTSAPAAPKDPVKPDPAPILPTTSPLTNEDKTEKQATEGAKTESGPDSMGPEDLVAMVQVGGTEINDGAGGTLDAATISTVIKRYQGFIQNCYARALGENKGLQGKISVQLVISEGGRVISANTKEDTLGNDGATACVLGIIKRLKFPENPDGGNVTTTSSYTFTKHSK